ncbi:MAG: cytochrome c oxidase assembly protein [Gemmatirosa sp.]
MLHPDAALAPHDLWSAWELDPLFTVPLAASAVLFAVGTRRLWERAGSGRGVTRAQVLAFGLGWLALAIALVSPLHPMGSVLFSAHMTQHELLMVVAAPLLVLARPNVALAWALPPAWRRPATAWARTPAVAGTWRVLTTPMHAWWVHALALGAWHLPSLYQATLRSDVVHGLQHASFFGSALVFWWALLRARRAGRGAAVAYLFAASLATGALGALLTFANSLWYPAYAATTGPWGLTPLDDQRLGGMIMWMPGGLSYMLAALWLFGQMVRGVEPRVGRARAAPAVRAGIVAPRG